jgi:hypothetical protein
MCLFVRYTANNKDVFFRCSEKSETNEKWRLLST